MVPLFLQRTERAPEAADTLLDAGALRESVSTLRSQLAEANSALDSARKTIEEAANQADATLKLQFQVQSKLYFYFKNPLEKTHLFKLKTRNLTTIKLKQKNC